MDQNTNTLMLMTIHHYLPILLQQNATLIKQFTEQVVSLHKQYIVLFDDDDPKTTHEMIHRIKTELGITQLTKNNIFLEEKLSKSITHSGLDSLPVGSATYMLSRNPSRFYQQVRLLPSEFWTFYVELKAAIEQPRTVHSKNFSGQNRRERIKSGTSRALHSADELLLWFFHSDGVSASALELLFGSIHRTTVCDIADHVTECLNSVYSTEIQWPDEEERKSLRGLFAVDENAVALLDGTHCEIEAPEDLETNDEYYSGYKKTTTQSYLVWADALGFILKIEGPFPGRMSDRGTYSNSEFARLDSTLLSREETVIADGGFQGDGQFTMPARMKMINSDELESMKEALIFYNLAVADDRSAIEHKIHFIKDRARVLKTKYNRGLQRQGNLFYAAGRLLNRTQRIRMCRLDHNITMGYY